MEEIYLPMSRLIMGLMKLFSNWGRKPQIAVVRYRRLQECKNACNNNSTDGIVE